MNMSMSYACDPMTYEEAWPTEDPNDLTVFAATEQYNLMGSATMVSGLAPSMQFDSEPYPPTQLHQTTDYVVGPPSGVSTARPWDLHHAQSAFDTGNSPWPTPSSYLPAPLSSTSSPLLGPFDLSSQMLVSSPPPDLADSYSYDLSLGGGYNLDAYSEYSVSQAPTPIPQSQSQSPADTTSSGSGSGSGGFQCSLCGDTFVNQKNLDRHFLSERHNEGAPKFTCACGYVQARKDNYRRHLQSCSFRIEHPYVCSCADRTLDKAHHEAHIDKCGRKRRGKQSSR
ncbi:hypothetical protein QBC44DRAFT_162684 [Cladorrhinum sp. PSN332]|nr:hypothetical protein QBC44DRAFT_162684 [Cladorrhinum sp. PSN332]